LACAKQKQKQSRDAITALANQKSQHNYQHTLDAHESVTIPGFILTAIMMVISATGAKKNQLLGVLQSQIAAEQRFYWTVSVALTQAECNRQCAKEKSGCDRQDGEVPRHPPARK